MPGHDPLVLDRYPAARAGLEGWVARLDVDPERLSAATARQREAAKRLLPSETVWSDGSVDSQKGRRGQETNNHTGEEHHDNHHSRAVAAARARLRRRGRRGARHAVDRARARREVVRIGAADQDLLSDHHRRDRAAPETVRQGRHQGGADDLSRRRGRLRGARGGCRRRDHELGLVGCGRPEEGRDGKERRRRGARLLRLASGGEDGFADQGRQGARRQEDRHHVRRLGYGHSGAVDAGRPQGRVHPRAARRRRAGAEPALRQHRRDACSIRR